MNARARRLKARMMVALDDAAAIEARPIEAVNTELDRLGVDPSGAIALARGLSRSRKTPTGRLLDQLEDAEAATAEIDALEKARIDEVGAMVPGGSAAAIAADAKRRSGRPSNVMPFKRRRFAVLGASSSVVAIAACLVLFIAVRPDQLEQTKPRTVREADAIADAVPDRMVDEAFVEERPAPKEHMEPSALEQGSLARRSAIEGELSDADTAFALNRPEKTDDREGRATMVDRVPTPVPSGPSEGGRQIETATAAAPSSETPPLPKARPVQRAKAPTPEADAPPAPDIEREQAAQLPWQTGVADLPDDIRALLIIEPSQMPTTLEASARILPERDLAIRLPQAKAAAGNRTVVALISFMREGEIVDAAVVADDADQTPMALNALVEPVPAPADPFQQDFRLIELPRIRD